ncbi:DUF4359 domain-containing protein [Calothrix sp. UHCC 0171]|uniref:DUF4359 domain-containing protein n=1 Tax=Calothrix sp. UHCC 0171 TaxID=3110245 RepID=UPI002B219E45|nr:DUF4359 domain-containing protein [Calothrix sp. UHCC 0171]MEA5573148.1 DUF4359 domain-containing protein [Calothrix sp. UHCC 0171]
MKVSTIITSLGVLGLFLLGVVMTKNNPSQAEYEQYAVRELTGYLKSNICQKTPRIIGEIEKIAGIKCNEAFDSVNPQIRDIIAATTDRQDFIVFSIYRTELKLNEWVPSYKFETVGALGNFYTYSAEKK